MESENTKRYCDGDVGIRFEQYAERLKLLAARNLTDKVARIIPADDIVQTVFRTVDRGLERIKLILSRKQ